MESLGIGCLNVNTPKEPNNNDAHHGGRQMVLAPSQKLLSMNLCKKHETSTGSNFKSSATTQKKFGFGLMIIARGLSNI